MSKQRVSIGIYIAMRLKEVGIADYFTVPGDYNLLLLDELLKVPDLAMVSCCNELNAGYAADGYARSNGAAALVVTYSVGGLSAVNAIAGAYAQNLPVIVISGAPNTSAESEAELLHHTLGRVDYKYVRQMFSHVTTYSVTLENIDEAPGLIDKAIKMAMSTKKPVYIEVPCNIANALVDFPKPLDLSSGVSDKVAIESCINETIKLLKGAKNALFVLGGQLKSFCSNDSLQNLINTVNLPVVALPDAKGTLSEQNPNYKGIYWGVVGNAKCKELVEQSDLLLVLGPMISDYISAGYTANLDINKSICIYPTEISIFGKIFPDIIMQDFINRMHKTIENSPNFARNLQLSQGTIQSSKRELGSVNGSSLVETKIPDQLGDLESKEYAKPKAYLKVKEFYNFLQSVLTNDTTIIVETGDTWFNAIELNLPADASYEVQMQYGSIGWSVGAALGYSCATKDQRRILALVGDGSFQMTAQEISTMIRYDLNPIIFVMNNDGYLIEKKIHDGPYNLINNWNYAHLVDVFKTRGKKANGFKVSNLEQLKHAFSSAINSKAFTLIEVILDPNDCNPNLITWGKLVAKHNSRPSQQLP